MPVQLTETLLTTLSEPATVFAPLCLDPLTARLAEELGFQFGYLSGGALGYSYAVSEALLTLDEICDVTRRITQRSGLGIIVDGGVGFGDAVHVTRAVWEIEAAGAVAIELEDQVAPKRVSHHRGIEHLVPVDIMAAKIEHAAAARRNADFLIIARTGAVKNEGFASAINRLKAYRNAGADVLMLMPADDQQIRDARAALSAPLATITALDAKPPAEWQALGWNLIIDPFTAQVLAFEAVRTAYKRFQDTGRTGTDRKTLFATYRELPGMAGLDELYAIEDVTTEKPSTVEK
ncbi:MAG: isocitrate lyase/phosphoenolpyruvate mutase family protein [Gammaproteobacteria bacterium]|nr:isocitrate lyase/phosphoenolpyruvate mutase family protein [Gammaproteobacteria bacterium]